MSEHKKQNFVEQLTQAFKDGEAQKIDKLLEVASEDSELCASVGEASRQYLHESGYASTSTTYEKAYAQYSSILDAVSEPDTPPTLMEYMIERTGQRPTRIAKTLNTTLEFLDDISCYPETVPLAVKERVAEQILHHYDILKNNTLKMLSATDPEHNPLTRMAASRENDQTCTPQSFESILERSGMTKGQQAFWRSST